MLQTLLIHTTIVLILCCGCSSAPKAISPREAFLKNAKQRSAYYKVYEVSPEAMRQHELLMLRGTKLVIEKFRQALNEENLDKTGLLEGLGRMETITEAMNKDSIQMIEKLEKHYNSETDVILFYHLWPDDENQEVGCVISRGGIPIAKEVQFGR